MPRVRSLPRRLTGSLGLTALSLALFSCGGATDSPNGPSQPPGPAAVTSVVVTPATVTLTAPGQTAALTATVQGNPAAPVTWTSSAPAIATVAGNGTTATVTAVAAGTATISADAGGQRGNAAITVTVPATPALSATATSVSVTPGATARSTITLGRTNLGGAVAVTLGTVPSGLTATVEGTPTTGTSVTVAVTAAASVAAGSYTIPVTASAGTVVAATTIAVTVLPPPAGIALSVSPTAVSVAQGASAAITATITRTGFAGPIALVASGLPAGASIAFSESLTTATSITATIRTTGATPVGVSTVTLTASGTGVAAATATVALTVTAPPTNSGSWTLRFCAPGPIPQWVAALGTDGQWRRVLPSAPGEFPLPRVENGGYAYAVVQSGTSFVAVVFHAQLPREELTCVTPSPTGRKTVRGRVEGIVRTTPNVLLSLGGRTPSSTVTESAPDFTITQVVDGPVDLLAARYRLATSGLTTEIDRIVLRRDLEPADGSTLPTVDFEGSEAFAPAPVRVTLQGGSAPDSLSVVGQFQTRSGAVAVMPFFLASSGSLLTLPADRARSTDRFLFAGAAVDRVGEARVQRNVFRTGAHPGADLTLPLPPVPAVPSITVTTRSPYPRFVIRPTVTAEYEGVFGVSFQQGARSLSIGGDPAYLRATGRTTFELPDFSGVDGWQNSWVPAAGTVVNWITSQGGTTAVSGGELVRSATITGTIVP